MDDKLKQKSTVFDDIERIESKPELNIIDMCSLVVSYDTAMRLDYENAEKWRKKKNDMKNKINNFKY